MVRQSGENSVLMNLCQHLQALPSSAQPSGPGTMRPAATSWSCRLSGACLHVSGEAMGIRDRPISPGSPWQNGYAERLIGTMRRECLDRVLILGELHLRRVLLSYA